MHPSAQFGLFMHQLHNLTVIHYHGIAHVIIVNVYQSITLGKDRQQKLMIQRNSVWCIAFNLLTDHIEHQTMSKTIHQLTAIFLRQVDLNAQFQQIRLAHLSIAQ